MKTLIAVSALILIANAALANDIYGNFASPELDASVPNRYGVEAPEVGRSGVQVSLYTLYKGNPDVHNDLGGFVPRESRSDHRLTAYDRLVIGDPDTGPGVQFDVAPGMGTDEGVASTELGGGGNI
ncbi:MAG: hypothetical protein WCA32_19635 [Chromatiaceae bacterium]